tara:strand:+ start:1545 stop:1841 length:297 start_codon:yes stop_codon:yes gene_type:complete
MGVIYSVACKECKVTRDLDKFYSSGFLEEEDRDSMLEFAKVVGEKPWRHALLTSFMYKHAGHECVFFWENMACEDELYPCEGENEYSEDIDYWDTSCE